MGRRVGHAAVLEPSEVPRRALTASVQLRGGAPTSRRIGLAVACVVAAFVLVVIFIAPRAVQIDRYRPEVVSYIEQQTGRRIEIGHLALSVLPQIAIRVDHFAMSNAPGFPRGNWLAVKRINARLDFGALMHGQIVIRALKLEHPVLDLLSDGRGQWNYQINPPRGPIRLPPNDPPPFVIQAIIKLAVDNGEVSGGELQPDGATGPSIFQARDFSLNLGQIKAAQLNAMGERGIQPPPSSGSEKPGSSSPRSLSSQSTAGRLSIASLRVSKINATRVETDIRISPAQIRLDHVRFDFYGGRGQGTVALQIEHQPFHYDAQTQLTGVNLAKLLAEFPAARGQMTGTLDGRATFSGMQAPSSQPWEGQQGAGAFTIRKGAWPKLKLDPNLMQLVKLAQLGSGSGDLSRFSLVSAHWRLANGVITVPNLRVLGEGATLDSSGTVDLARDDRLDFQGRVDMAARRNLLSNLLASISHGTFQGGKIKIPFTVSGTAEKPVLGLRVGAGG
jgi:uncharacterized protein involved in outer membrane biogenesis